MKETLPRRVSARLRFSLRLESGSGVEGELRLKREREPRGFKQLQKTNLLSSFASDNTYYVVQGFASKVGINPLLPQKVKLHA